jgi:predicted nuclease with RNAse H fold
MVGTDDEMVARVIAISPALVSVDSPLSVPFGRTRVEDDDPGRSEFGIMRRCERELKRRGINVYPCLLPSMQGLTRRGMRLATRLRRLGIPVIESYPGAAQDIMGIPRKGLEKRSSRKVYTTSESRAVF